MENACAEPVKNSRVPTFLCLLLIAVMAGGVSLGKLYEHRQEVFISENTRLSEAFTKAYSGPAFDVLRVKCWERGSPTGGYRVDWATEYQQSGLSVKVEAGGEGYPCLVDAEKTPIVVIKNNRSNKPGYSVMTTGEETDSEFTPAMVEKLLSAVAAGNAEVQRKKRIEASWDASR